MDNKVRFQRGCWVTLMVVMIMLGFIGGAGSLNFAYSNCNHLYTIGGVSVIVIAVYAAITIYQKYLKSPKLQ